MVSALMTVVEVDRQNDASRAANHRRNARHSQQLPVARGGIDVSLVDVLRHRRRQHEENGVTGIDFGRKHRRERQRAEPGRQLCHQECRQHEVGIGDIRGWWFAPPCRTEPAGMQTASARQRSSRCRFATALSDFAPYAFWISPGEMMNEGPVSIRNVQPDRGPAE